MMTTFDLLPPSPPSAVASAAPPSPAPRAQANSAPVDSSAPDSRATEFQAVQGSPTESYSGATLLVEAYAAIWVILMAWIFLLWKKQAALGVRVDGLERAIDRAAAAAEKKAKS